MRDCLIMGCGRSGTSLVAGSLAKTGYFMGDDPMPPSPGNPKGYFESRVVESINEDILAQQFPKRATGVRRFFHGKRFGPAQRWLSRPPVDVALRSSPDLERRMQSQLRSPFALKDPRFCYTLHVWRPHLNDAVFVVVFREPGRTANSILTESDREPYLADLPVDRAWALDVWRLSYAHILDNHASTGDWLFLHYDQMFTGDGAERLCQFLNAPVDRDHLDRALKRSDDDQSTAPDDVRELYERLCDRAEYARTGE